MHKHSSQENRVISYSSSHFACFSKQIMLYCQDVIRFNRFKHFARLSEHKQREVENDLSNTMRLGLQILTT